ncbi:MAG: DUF2079 domain-containing protein, partial [Dehalococcoidia bacterium]|nr:DUF2079 domain-containing protein [Dehalococcoidia bacterium]
KRLNNGLVGDHDHAAATRAMLALIPPDAPVAAQTGLAPHLSRRQAIYLFPTLNDAEFVALDTGGQRYVAGRTTYEDGLEALLCDRSFGPVYAVDGALLFRRGAAPPPVVAALPATATPMAIAFDDGFALVGVDAAPVARVGELIRVTLYWRGTASRDWTVFGHLVDQNGEVKAQYDSPPQCGAAPASRWRPGQIIRDDRWLTPNAGIRPGDYRILVGLYDPEDGARPRANGAERVDVGGVTIR